MTIVFSALFDVVITDLVIIFVVNFTEETDCFEVGWEGEEDVADEECFVVVVVVATVVDVEESLLEECWVSFKDDTVDVDTRKVDCKEFFEEWIWDDDEAGEEEEATVAWKFTLSLLI